MSPVQYVLGIAAAVSVFGLVIEMLRRRRLRERHAAWWIVAGGIAIVVSVFPVVLEQAAHFLGFDLPINLVFFASLVVLFLVALQHSSELTELESHNRSIVEKLVVLELKVEQLERPESADKSDRTQE